MEPNELETPKFFCKINDGEYKEMENAIEKIRISAVETIETVDGESIKDERIFNLHCIPYMDRTCMKKSFWPKNVKMLFNNNWRKMHYLPLIRRQSHEKYQKNIS